MPGPASTVGERPPINLAIRVRFLPETLLLSRRFTQFYARPRFIARAKRRRRHLLETKSVLQLSLCIKGNVALKIGPMTSLLSRVDNDVIILYYAILIYNNTTLATWGGISTHLTDKSTAESLEMTEEQCLRPSDGNKRKRITGWLAGHTIHLEIEEWPG